MKLLTVLVASLITSSAFASEPVSLHKTHLTFQLSPFKYESATVHKPLLVDVSSGECNFKLSLVGVLSGGQPTSSLTGRIESGVCNGVPVHQGIVRAHFERAEGSKLGTVGAKIDVVVFN